VAFDAAMTMHPAFSPAVAEAAELDAATVGRADLLDTLTRRISGAARDGARPHTLLLGRQGAGKTHTLRVAVHRSLANHGVAKAVLPVFVPEDGFAIGGYPDLLVEAARTIGIGEAAAAMRRDRDTLGIEEAIRGVAGDRMILLCVENLDRVFDGLGETGQGSLRAWVETSTAVMILATAPALFPGVASRDHPWYGSFMVERLTELDVADVATIVASGARRRGAAELAAFVTTPEGLERITAVYEVFGGMPRAWQLLAAFVDVDALEAVEPAVNALLDQLVPNYQRQLGELPAGEQRLVVELARGDGARTVGDLAAAVGVSNQSAATALGRLSTSRWVTSTKADSDRRATWYDLTDPLVRRVLRYRER
jgi:hypothetical protein